MLPWPACRRVGQQPDAARRLPRRRFGGEGGALRADVTRCSAWALVDVPGHLPGARPGAGGVLCRLKPAMPRAARAWPPVTRKAYGGAYIAMQFSARSALAPGLAAARPLWARWPRSQSPAPGARLLRGVAGEAARGRSSVGRGTRGDRGRPRAGAVDLGVIDAIIEPAETRLELARLSPAPQSGPLTLAHSHSQSPVARRRVPSSGRISSAASASPTAVRHQQRFGTTQQRRIPAASASPAASDPYKRLGVITTWRHARWAG